MLDKKKVLVIPGGTEIGLEIQKALRFCKDVQLFSAGSDVSNHAPYVFRNHFVIPDIYNRDFIHSLNNLIVKNKIDYILPAYDDIIVYLMENQSQIKAKVISSPLQTCLICRSKKATYNKLRNKLKVPKTFVSANQVTDFPVFVKPDKGQGSQRSFKVDDRKSLEALLNSNPDLIIMEYLPGKEYTIDCFTHRQKGLLFCNGRERIRVRAGISMNSKPVNEQLIKRFAELAKIISEQLELYGAWFFQLKEDSQGNLKLLEIAPRISGTMATSRVLGVNFPLLSIYEAEGKDLELMVNDCDVEIDRALTNRYKHSIKYSKVYVDLDDTLLLDGKVNTMLVAFLYQAIEAGCRIILITKNGGDMSEVLKRHRLTSLFDKVISLNKTQSKADFVDSTGAIFIDDSFSERKSVYNKHKIPTFDCSMIELLLDDRV